MHVKKEWETSLNTHMVTGRLKGMGVSQIGKGKQIKYLHSEQNVSFSFSYIISQFLLIFYIIFIEVS